MIQLIIPSKDRACQLDLLLRSLDNLLNIEFHVNVIWKASSKEFQEGYEKLFDNFVSFFKEENFREDVLDLCKGNLCCIMCDDNVIYRTIEHGLPQINPGKVFSLRLGLNTIVQNHTIGSFQPRLNQYAGENIIEWNPHLYNNLMNYGYPFSLDGHIYNTKQFVNLASQFNWKNTNELEGGLFNNRFDITILSSFRQSASVNIPLNNLSGYTKSMDISPAFLNDEFLKGKRLYLPENINIVGCHQNIELELR